MPNPMNSSNFPLDRENVTRCKSLESDALGKIPWNNCAVTTMSFFKQLFKGYICQDNGTASLVTKYINTF